MKIQAVSALVLSLVLSSLFMSVAMAEANDDLNVVLPKSLNCKGVYSVYGSPDGKSDLKDYAAIQLFEITRDKVNLKWGPSSMLDHGIVQMEPGVDKIVFDFGVAAKGGDSYLSFSFRKEDLAKFLAGKQAQLAGLYEDGFDYTDGYHTSNVVVVHCTQ